MEPRTFKKKGHEQQYKHKQQVKSVVSEAKDAAPAENRTQASLN